MRDSMSKLVSWLKISIAVVVAKLFDIFEEQ
jgi:hypothetical protein